jgi:nitroreductase
MFHIRSRVIRLSQSLRKRLALALMPLDIRRALEPAFRANSREEVSRLNSESLGALVRLYAHAIEKAVSLPSFDATRGQQKVRFLKSMLSAARDHGVDPGTVAWAENMLRLYEHRLSENSLPLQESSAVSHCAEWRDCLLNIVKSRRSTRFFKSLRVEPDAVWRALDIVKYAPTSCHRQAVKIVITLNPDRARDCHKCCVGQSGFGDFIPAFAAICTDSNPYTMPEEYPLLFVDGAICAAFFVLACQTQGVATTLMAWISGRGNAENRLRSLLQIPPNYQIVVTCVLGYPERQTPSPPRKPLMEWVALVD